MRKALIVGCAILFVSIAGLAQTPSPAPLSQEALAAILGQPDAVAGQPTSPQTGEPALTAAKHPLPVKATCTAKCVFSGTVSCTASSCSATNGTSCSSPGSVTCGGVKTSCGNLCYVSCRCAGFTDAFCRANC